MTIICPPPVSLKAIPAITCNFKLDQIVRFALQRRQPTATPPFATLTDLQTLENWTTLKAATDNTKIVVTPIADSVVIPASEGLTTGGNDNTTFNGIPNYNGEGMVTVTGRFANLPPVVKRALDLLSSESLPSAVGTTNLTAYFFNKDGYTIQENPVTTGDVATTIYRGIPIYNWRLSSLGSEGLNAPSVHNFSFSMPSKWADYLTAVLPNFDVLADI